MKREVEEEAALANIRSLVTDVLDVPPDYCYYERRRTLEEIRDEENKANPHGFKRAFRFEYE